MGCSSGGECGDDDQLTEVRGDSWFVDGDAEQNGAPIPLTDGTILVTLRTDENDQGTPVLEYSYILPNNADTAAGTFSFVVPSNLTLIDAGDYWIDIKVIWPGTPPVVWTMVRPRTITIIPRIGAPA